MVEMVLGIVGFVIAAVTLLFTDQGREIIDNLRYHLGRLAHIPRRLLRRRAPVALAADPADRSTFVADITIPDGTKIPVNSRFTKIWEIRNVGSVVWNSRYLQRQGPIKGPGRLKSPLRVRIPYTAPGQCCRVAVRLTAPPLPRSCYAEWKMVDGDGRILLPNQKPVYVAVDVVEKL